jgi:hypothetical protein
MNRFLVIIVLVLSLSKVGYAQYGRFTVGFATGPSIPVGNFANHNINSQYGGFAKSGLNINGSIGFRLSRYAGIGAMVTSTNNPFNSEAYASQYSAQQGVLVKGTSGSWKATSAFFGIFYSIPVKRFFFDIRLYRGFMACTSAELKLQSYDNQYTLTQKPGTGVSSYAYDFGTSVKYTVGESKRVFLAANVDFMLAQINFSNVQVVTTAPGTVPSYQSTSFSQPYSNISVSFGVGVILGKMIY